jgi:hypothetical protein
MDLLAQEGKHNAFKTKFGLAGGVSLPGSQRGFVK